MKPKALKYVYEYNALLIAIGNYCHNVKHSDKICKRK